MHATLRQQRTTDRDFSRLANLDALAAPQHGQPQPTKVSRSNLAAQPPLVETTPPGDERRVVQRLKVSKTANGQWTVDTIPGRVFETKEEAMRAALEYIAGRFEGDWNFLLKHHELLTDYGAWTPEVFHQEIGRLITRLKAAASSASSDELSARFKQLLEQSGVLYQANKALFQKIGETRGQEQQAAADAKTAQEREAFLAEQQQKGQTRAQLAEERAAITRTRSAIRKTLGEHWADLLLTALEGGATLETLDAQQRIARLRWLETTLAAIQDEIRVYGPDPIRQFIRVYGPKTAAEVLRKSGGRAALSNAREQQAARHDIGYQPAGFATPGLGHLALAIGRSAVESHSRTQPGIATAKARATFLLVDLTTGEIVRQQRQVVVSGIQGEVGSREQAALRQTLADLTYATTGRNDGQEGSRARDAEVQVMEEVLLFLRQREIGDDAKRRFALYLYVTRVTCPSCADMLYQIKRRYPQLATIQVIYDDGDVRSAGARSASVSSAGDTGSSAPPSPEELMHRAIDPYFHGDPSALRFNDLVNLYTVVDQPAVQTFLRTNGGRVGYAPGIGNQCFFECLGDRGRAVAAALRQADGAMLDLGFVTVGPLNEQEEALATALTAQGLTVQLHIVGPDGVARRTYGSGRRVVHIIQFGVHFTPYFPPT